ncbi:MAG TPA: hypothetical protein DDX33_02870 [Rikenellaceae bacterium]|nr:hypothetical protein [Rikenellaceae bacterium]
MLDYDFSSLAIKGKASRGNLVTKNVIQRISLKSKGISTIEGKDIWYDTDIQRLNDEEHGLYLGKFEDGDKVLAVFRNGTFYTTSFDLVNRYQGDVLFVEKFDPNKTYTALYFDGASKSFYVKRFSFIVSDNTPICFISDHPKSYLVELSSDRHPQYEVIWALEDKPAEAVDAEEWIAKKGIAAKGKKCSSRNDVKSVRFIEPLVKEDDNEIPSEDDETPQSSSAEEPEAIIEDSEEETYEEPTLF